nr:HEAT repeat domain-containing protein [Brasilonema octagenarum]
MVLADPGMGKSTLLGMEAVTFAQKERQKFEGNRELNELILPLFLRLSELAKHSKEVIDAVVELIERDYPNTAPPIIYLLKEKLKKGQCLLLLDALDEVPKVERNRIELRERLNRFAQNYPCPIICTSRIVGYAGALIDGAKEVEIVPFSDQQIEEYIRIWFTNADEYLRNKSVCATKLIRELHNKPQIRGLVQNPLLLSLICSLYQEQGLTLPSRRAQVYEKAFEYMLGKWSQNRNEESEGKIRAKLRLLEYLAYYFSEESQEIFEFDDLYDQIEEYLQAERVPSDFRNVSASELITELSEQNGILQKLYVESDEYLFLHRTFQEYLTACYLERAKNGIELIKKHLWDYEWHETISLMTGLMKKPIPLLQTILNEKDDIFQTLLLLTGRCVAECNETSHPLIAEIINRIHQFWESYADTAEFIRPIMVALGQTQPYMLEKLRQTLRNPKPTKKADISARKPLLINPNYSLLLETLPIMGRIGNSTVVTDIYSARQYEKTGINEEKTDGFVDRAVADALETLGTPDALHTLLFMYNGDKFVGRRRRRAWRGIGVEALITVITDRNIDGFVRMEGAWILGDMGNSQALEVLPRLLMDQTEDVRVRGQAAVGLGRSGKPEAFQFLMNALSDPNQEIVNKVIWALGRLGNQRAISALIATLRTTRDSQLIESIMTSLKEIGGENVVKSLLNFLKDESFSEKVLVIKTLGNLKSPHAIPTLVQCVDNEQLREGAISALRTIGVSNYLVLSSLAKYINDKKYRRQIFYTLIEIGSSESIALLAEHLGKKDELASETISQKLCYLGSPEALQILLSAMVSDNQAVRETVASCLMMSSQSRNNPQILLAMARFSKDSNPQVKKQGVYGLLQVHPSQAVDEILESINHQETQDWALELLGKLDNVALANKLIQLLQKTFEQINGELRYRVLQQVISSLSQIKTPQVIQALVSLLNEQDATIKSLAAHTLAKLGCLECISVLKSELNHNDQSIRSQAFKDLVSINAPQVCDVCIEILNKNNSDSYREEAISALERMATVNHLERLIQNLKINVYQPDIFLLIRRLAIRFSKEGVPFIPVYPENVKGINDKE